MLYVHVQFNHRSAGRPTAYHRRNDWNRSRGPMVRGADGRIHRACASGASTSINHARCQTATIRR